MRCPIHLSIGQEAIAVGICHNLNNYDQIVSNHRCHAHYLAKVGMKKMINEFYGNSDGCSVGRGGQCIFSIKKKEFFQVFLLYQVRFSWCRCWFSFKYNKKKNIAVIFIGDAAIEEGFFMKV